MSYKGDNPRSGFSPKKKGNESKIVGLGTPAKKSGFNRVINGNKMIGGFPRNSTRIPFEGN